MLNAKDQIEALSSDEEEIDPNTGKAYHVPPPLMSPHVGKGSVDLPTLRESKQVKNEAATKSLTIAMETHVTTSLRGQRRPRKPRQRSSSSPAFGVRPRRRPPPQQWQPIQIRWTSPPMEASPLAWTGPLSI